jgi:hypothetical protein
MSPPASRWGCFQLQTSFQTIRLRHPSCILPSPLNNFPWPNSHPMTRSRPVIRPGHFHLLIPQSSLHSPSLPDSLFGHRDFPKYSTIRKYLNRFERRHQQLSLSDRQNWMTLSRQSNCQQYLMVSEYQGSALSLRNWTDRCWRRSPAEIHRSRP